MSKPTEAEITEIVTGKREGKAPYRHLTLERQLKFMRRELDNAVARIPEWETAEIDKPRRDAAGQYEIDPKTGLVEIDRVRVSKRSVVARPYVEQINRLQDEYRAFLRVTPDERERRQDELQKALKNAFGDKPAHGLDESRERSDFARAYQIQKGWA